MYTSTIAAISLAIFILLRVQSPDALADVVKLIASTGGYSR